MAALTAKEYRQLVTVARVCAMSTMNKAMCDCLLNALEEAGTNKRTRRMVMTLCGYGKSLKADLPVLRLIRAAVGDHAVTSRGIS